MPLAELIRPAELDPRISGPLGGGISVSRIAISGGHQFTMDLSNEPMDVVRFYDLLEATAPNHPLGDGPPEVVDDWLDPEKANDGDTEADQRMKDHGEWFGRHWADFMPSRELLISLVDEVPVTKMGEIGVKQITDIEDKAMFVAHYIVGGHDSSSIAEIFANAELDEKTSAELMTILKPFFLQIQSNPETSEQYAWLTLSIYPEIAKILQSSLLNMPEGVTERLIQSTIKPVERTVKGQRKRIWQREADQTVSSFIKPTHFFSSRHSVQEVVTDDGVIAVPYKRVGYISSTSSWLIPRTKDFELVVREDGSNYLAAEITDPTYDLEAEYGNMYGLQIDYAVDATTFMPSPKAPKVLPRITWTTDNRTGERQFVLGDEVRQSDKGLIVVSGLVGIMLAAAIQPEVRAQWPHKKRLKELGVAQLPVWSLIVRDQIANGGLLKNAEPIAA